ncbi:MAG: transaldolase family protein [Pararhizobium sp.]
MTPRFFLDSADTDAWRRFKAEGWLHGATTNPTILEKAGLVSSIETARRLVTAAEELGLGELQVQSWGGAAELLVANGQALAALSGIVTVKIPATSDGFQAAARLKGEGCRVTLTACYTARQCAAAVALGLDYVAPYYGRMREAGLDADARLDAMKSIADPAGMRVLVASVRGGEQLEALARRGFETFTLAPAVAAALVTDADSDAAAAVFEAAAGRWNPRSLL